MDAEEFMHLDVTRCQIELWQGIVHERPFLDAASGCAVNRLMIEVGNFCSEDDTTIGLAGGTGFQIERDPDTVIAPRGAFFTGNRLRNTAQNAYLVVSPDIVIETWTPNGHAAEYQERAFRWLHFGVKQVWELNAAAFILTVH